MPIIYNKVRINRKIGIKFAPQKIEKMPPHKKNSQVIDYYQHEERRDSDRFNIRLACLLQELKDRENVLKLYTRDISFISSF